MEDIDSTIALCDKVVLYNVPVCDVLDLESLETQGIVTVNRSSAAGLVLTSSGEAFSSLTLDKCALFDAFSVRAGKKDGYPYIYSRLELSIDRGDGTFNLRCWTIDEIKERLREIERYLSDEWGILIDTNCSKFKTIEVNRTLQLDESYPSYVRPLRTMFQLLPKGKRKNMSEVGGDEHKTFYAGATREIIKAYDKTNQINLKIKTSNLEISLIDEQYLRFELTLNSRKIVDEFGSNEVIRITDDAINSYFDDFIRKNVALRWESFKQQREKQLKKVIREEWKKSESHFVENLLLRAFNEEDKTGLPLIMDVDEVKPLLKSIIPKDAQRRRRLYKRILVKCAQNYGEKFVKNDGLKMEELIDKLARKKHHKSDTPLKVGSALEQSGFDDVFA